MNKINIKSFALLASINMLMATSAFSASGTPEDISEIQHIAHCIAPLVKKGEFWEPMAGEDHAGAISALIPLPRANREQIITLMVQMAGFA